MRPTQTQFLETRRSTSIEVRTGVENLTKGIAPILQKTVSLVAALVRGEAQ